MKFISKIIIKLFLKFIVNDLKMDVLNRALIAISSGAIWEFREEMGQEEHRVVIDVWIKNRYNKYR